MNYNLKVLIFVVGWSILFALIRPLALLALILFPITYVVMAHKVLNDGELYRAIRVEILKRGSFPPKGERLVITAPNVR